MKLHLFLFYQYDKNFKMLSAMSPSYSAVEEGISKLSQEIHASDEVNPMENDLVEVIHKYNIMYKHIFKQVFFYFTYSTGIHRYHQTILQITIYQVYRKLPLQYLFQLK